MLTEKVRIALSLIVASVLTCFVSGESVLGRSSPVAALNVATPYGFPLYELKFRGGAVVDGDEDEEDFEDAVEEMDKEELEDTGIQSESVILDTVLDLTKRSLIMVGKATLVITKATSRAVLAAFQCDEVEGDEENQPLSLTTRVVRTLQRMWDAALSPSEEEESSELATMIKSKSKRRDSDPASSYAKEDMSSDFGSFLAKSYGVSSDQGETPVLGGTIGDALREVRSKARLLVVFVPSERPGRRKNTPDHEAIRSLISPEVSEVAEKRAQKKQEGGSYILWGAKASSPEAITAIKRLKAKQPSKKGDKRPILVVAYPAQVSRNFELFVRRWLGGVHHLCVLLVMYKVLDSAGAPKLVPRLLAQHHCSPPPSEKLMAAWLNALRKRHAKVYAAMHHELKEAQLFKERKEGYKSSVISDVQRGEQERVEEEQRIAKEQAENERLEMMVRRREELRASLPDEPDTDEVDAMTIALRFPDGRVGQRRFTRNTRIGSVFNWVDSTFGMEREAVLLTTLNGQKSFSWDEAEGLTLGDSGLGKMTGLRVSETKPAIIKETAES